MTPPRPTGFGPLSPLWYVPWAVAIALAAVVVALEWAIAAPWKAVRRGTASVAGIGSDTDPEWLLWGLLAALALLALAACSCPTGQPCYGPGFRGSMGGPPRTAAATTVPNPFLCPRTTQP